MSMNTQSTKNTLTFRGPRPSSDSFGRGRGRRRSRDGGGWGRRSRSHAARLSSPSIDGWVIDDRCVRPVGLVAMVESGFGGVGRGLAPPKGTPDTQVCAFRPKGIRRASLWHSITTHTQKATQAREEETREKKNGHRGWRASRRGTPNTRRSAVCLDESFWLCGVWVHMPPSRHPVCQVDPAVPPLV